MMCKFILNTFHIYIYRKYYELHIIFIILYNISIYMCVPIQKFAYSYKQFDYN